MSKLFGWTWRIGLILILFFGYQTARDWWWRDAAENVDTISVEIDSGVGVKGIANILEERGVIERPGSFAIYVMTHGLSRDLHAGSFALPAGENFATLASLLQSSMTMDVSVTIPEGYTVAQMGTVYEEKFGIHIATWNEVTKEDEGYLFPDTYRFAPTVTAQEIRDAMRGNFDRRMSAAGVAPTAEQLIIASILEREVRRPEEMADVSDIIRKRLEIGMALQMDSTVNYVTQRGLASVTYEDLETDSPYNTYKYPGLPPGPISNPGLNAIRAAINPASNPYYYFLTDPEGKVYYATTFEQHVANRQYLR